MLNTFTPSPASSRVDATRWHLSSGTHFANLQSSGTANTGWTATGSPSALTPGTGDFNTTADFAPAGISLATTASAQSIRFQTLLFGSYAQWAMARDILGYEPTKLCFSVWASFAVNTANESLTGFGFVTQVAAITADAHKVAWIHSDGTNFTFRENTNTDAGAAKDTALHQFMVKIDATNMEWFIDGTSQGTLSTPADVWPVSWQVNGAAARTNTVQMASLVVWYE